MVATAAVPNKAMTIMYALGWTQHSQGSQMIRTAAIVQLLLGNVGIAGGGMNALRGHSNIQGLTDLGLHARDVVLQHGDKPELYHGLPSDPKISPWMSLWKGAAKPLALAAIGRRGGGGLLPVQQDRSAGVLETNPLLEEKPELVHLDPYGKGWLARLRLRNFQANLPQLVQGAQVARAMGRHAESVKDLS